MRVELEGEDGERGFRWSWVALLVVACFASAVPFSVFLLGALVGGDGDDSDSECVAAAVAYEPNDDAGPNMTVAKGVYEAGLRRDVSDRVLLALMEAAAVESNWTVVANDGVRSDQEVRDGVTQAQADLAARSLDMPHDRVSSDYTSVGPLQQQVWWGPLEVLMDPGGSADLFLDRAVEVDAGFVGSAGALAQAVQGSAHPERYDAAESAARAMMAALDDGATDAPDAAGAVRVVSDRDCPPPAADEGGGGGVVRGDLGSGEWKNPLPGWTSTSGFGERGCLGMAECSTLISFHRGIDFATPDGAGTVHAPVDMEITFVKNVDDGNGCYVMGRVLDGTAYIMNFHHLEEGSALVEEGDEVAAGTPLGAEGATGISFGEHLHLQVHSPDAPDSYPSLEHAIDPTQLLVDKGILKPPVPFAPA